MIEAIAVDAEHIQSLTRNALVDNSITSELRIIPDPPQQAVGNPGRPSRSSGNLQRPLTVDFAPKNGSRTSDDTAKLSRGLKLKALDVAKTISQRRRQ
jgi:hypothetical protein